MGDRKWKDDIWVTRLIEYLSRRTIDRPLIVGALTVGLVPTALSAVFFWMTWGEVTPRYIISHLLVIVIGLVGPSAIYYWNRRVFVRFVDDVSDLTSETAKLEELAERYSHVFRRHYWVFSLLLIAFFVGVLLSNMSYFRSIGVAGVGDPAFWVFLLTGVTWAGVVGIGFHIPIVAILFIRSVGQLDLTIEPLHPDGLGGLSAIGSFAIWTTMLMSIGSLGFPYVFLLLAEGGAGTVLYPAVGFYVFVIGASFVYPTVYVNRRAQAVREEELDRMRRRIRELEAQARDPSEHGSTDEIAKRLEIRRLRDEYQDYATVSLYPLSVGIITRLLTSILLPIFFILFEMWFSQTI